MKLKEEHFKVRPEKKNGGWPNYPIFDAWYGRCIGWRGRKKSWLWDGLYRRPVFSTHPPIKSPLLSNSWDSFFISAHSRNSWGYGQFSLCFSGFCSLESRKVSRLFKSWSNLGFRERFQLRPVGNDLSQTLSPRGRLRNDKLLKNMNAERLLNRIDYLFLAGLVSAVSQA